MSAYSLPDLPYRYDALEPHIDAQTMEIHHTQHHRGYVDQLNTTLDTTDELRAAGDQPVEDLLWNLGKIPEESRNAVRNFGGGHANHSLFWTVLSGDGGGEPTGPIARVLEEEFGSFEAFKARFTTVATGHFGSGWAWLVKARNRLVAYSLPNQDSPLAAEEVPILGLDLWEHAYYLRYQARRRDYVDAFWNIVSWDEVNRRWEAAEQL
ncbi:MAG: superoxide dismutase [Pseudonocardiaceae bacterium]|nr:superoxide dismutase [Pseudonocardiaceae bacterium]